MPTSLNLNRARGDSSSLGTFRLEPKQTLQLSSAYQRRQNVATVVGVVLVERCSLILEFPSFSHSVNDWWNLRYVGIPRTPPKFVLFDEFLKTLGVNTSKSPYNPLSAMRWTCAKGRGEKKWWINERFPNIWDCIHPSISWTPGVFTTAAIKIIAQANIAAVLAYEQRKTSRGHSTWPSPPSQVSHSSICLIDGSTGKKRQ